MTQLTKKQQQMLDAYRGSKCYTLNDCYNRHSEAKQRAYTKIERECWENDGWGIKIPSYNSMIFTMAYCYVDRNANIHLVYHTPTNKYDFIVID